LKSEPSEADMRECIPGNGASRKTFAIRKVTDQSDLLYAMSLNLRGHIVGGSVKSVIGKTANALGYKTIDEIQAEKVVSEVSNGLKGLPETDVAGLDNVIQEWDRLRLESFGGYPSEYRTIGGHVVIATAEDGKPMLRCFPVERIKNIVTKLLVANSQTEKEIACSELSD
jgi:hypothetical protein